MPMICSADMLAAMSEAPIAHHGSVPAGKEIVPRVLAVPALFPRHPLGENEQRHGVGDDYRGINAGQQGTATPYLISSRSPGSAPETAAFTVAPGSATASVLPIELNAGVRESVL